MGWAAALILGLLAGRRMLPLTIAAPVAAALVIPGFALGILANTLLARIRVLQIRLRPLFRQLPSWAWIAGGALFVAFMLGSAPATNAMKRGTPEIQNGRYVLLNHGAGTVIDKMTYERLVTDEERGAISALGGCGVMAAVLCAVAARAQTADEN